MANISNATPAQLARLSAYVVQMRSVCAQLMKVQAQMNALNDIYNADIVTILGTTAGLTVADSSGLVGITPLLDSEVANITFWFQNLMATYYDSSHRALFTRACGASNTL
jgi:hypothetical protein